ncbi:MAG: hypothetical protein KAS63_06525, partial [Candidatus Heimdallarchaeota archaeon]|nr:hypothetical protein [Candidatus Heimdallarchaeota archaeon]MCK4954998.1 hypothetical protein [Candidatus Heimdallarchaeota archaeon]
MIYFKKVMRLCKFIIFIFVISQLILPTVSGSVGFSNSGFLINDQLSRIMGDSEILETSVQKIEDQSKYDPMISLSYTPINQIGSIGDNRSIIDELNVNHPFEVNLTKALYDSTTSTGNYSIAAISGYTSLLKYNISSMTAIPDYLYIEDAKSGNDDLADGSFLAIAQGFEITWDYAEFYGADIWFEIDGSGSLGTSALDLFLVKDNGSDPDINNASSILSNDINDPYTDINPVPSEDAGDLTFYDFEDVILEKGKYLVIANLSSVDATATENFAWVYKNGVPFLGNSCRYDATTLNWEERANADYTLMPYVLPLNSSQQPLTYNDPDLISLTDNALAINDVDQTIIGTGFHN